MASSTLALVLSFVAVFVPAFAVFIRALTRLTERPRAQHLPRA
jgi:hypothetical protein